MHARSWQVAAAVVLTAAFVGCTKEDEKSSGPPAQYVSIMPSTSSVVANGTNAVSLLLTDTGGGPLTVTTDRGTFAGGGQSAVVAAGTGTLVLTTCNSAVAGCTGTASITATSAAGSDTAFVSFLSLATACAASCSADPACPNVPCTTTGGAGICSSAPSTCIVGATCTPSPANATTETSCTDGADNDCSGAADGQDASCEGQPCQAGSTTMVWQSGTCTDLTSGLGFVVTSSRTRLPADGVASATVEVLVTSGPDPVANTTVDVALSDATLGTLAPASVATGGDGKARFTFTNSGATGVATLTASLPSLPAVSKSIAITIPRLGAFQVPADALEYAVLGAQGSGWNEMGYVSVQVLDDQGQPYPDGLAVRFQHESLGGSTLADPPAADTATCVAPACVANVGSTASGDAEPDTEGVARTRIYAGKVAGTLSVTATTTAAGVTRTVTLPTATVVGAKASGTNFSVVCSPRNLPALAETTCAFSDVDAPFTCQALLKDRFGNVLGRQAQVIFRTEAASVGPVTTTPAYDPAAGGASQMGLGIALQGFTTMGAALPFDVDPDLSVGEPSVTHALDGCGLRTHNPRDGVVTVVAVADGEEGFFDANGNGVYDALPTAEPFVDQGEPFVDQDDSGAWEAGEWFLDVDLDGAYDPPNGTWDADTKLWTQTVVVYTGPAATMIGSGGGLVGTRFAPAGLADACAETAPLPPFDLDYATTTSPAEPATVSVVASDWNLNFLTEETDYGISMIPDDAEFDTYYFGLPSYADLRGLDYTYWPCANGGAGPCTSQCRASGAAAPCVMQPRISGFSCGVTSEVLIVPSGEEPSAATLMWNVDVPWNVYGSDRVQHGGSAISVTSSAP